jgi:hypothetical protein
LHAARAAEQSRDQQRCLSSDVRLTIHKEQQGCMAKLLRDGPVSPNVAVGVTVHIFPEPIFGHGNSPFCGSHSQCQPLDEQLGASGLRSQRSPQRPH